jgi:hypothetical protein
MYSDVLLQLREAVRSKNEEGIRHLLHDNAPAHQSNLVKDFLAKKTSTTLEHSSYSDSAPANFTCSLD